ncbi:MAG TPA: polyphosphate kinase 2 family protein [Noviherbaspirillum sp.]|jgi:PPK2 family polyphosphate:nucleotide phosphotransferase|uniref:polyphosphate kinase 2 family protein n=1 Tax=Noviherbaspirillum sp. TaxID=1926288 RepID=UPI002DDD4862|nr:polyphosphate kinase 2 family protein [Noviherbaspirillum sp.]HEV2612585.1 polyphosphate kinase 2 family protein [Noviherbaspirillum sp.]
MKAHEEFRVGKSLTLADSDAGRKPLSRGDGAADKKQVEQLASQIAELQNLLYAEHKRKLLVILQGMDTSGKDGTVKGVFGKIDPLGIQTVAFKAPTQHEKDHDFLWRIHSRTPGKGEIVIFNRSHYEDVVITRVHDWIDDAECIRRYAHIRDFERMLVETGTVVLKFFLHISKDEQKKRLEARLADPQKHWKFDMQDIEERKSWDVYQRLYQQAINETSTDHAPWYVIPADSKTHRNLAIASVVLHTMQDMQLSYPPENPALANIKIT